MEVSLANSALVARFVKRAYDDLGVIHERRVIKIPRVLDQTLLVTDHGRAKVSYLVGSRDQAIRVRANADILNPSTRVATGIEKYLLPIHKESLMTGMVDALDVQGLITKPEYDDLSSLIARQSSISVTAVELRNFLDDSGEAFVNYLFECYSDHLEDEMLKDRSVFGEDKFDPRLVDKEIYRDPCLFFKREFHSRNGEKIYLSSWIRNGEYVIVVDRLRSEEQVRKIVPVLPEFIDKYDSVLRKSVSVVESLGCFLPEDISALKEIAIDNNNYTQKTFEILRFLQNTHRRILDAKRDGIISTMPIEAPSKDVHVGFEIVGLGSGEGILQLRIIEENKEDPFLDRGVVCTDLDQFLSSTGNQEKLEAETQMLCALSGVAPYLENVCDEASDLIIKEYSANGGNNIV